MLSRRCYIAFFVIFGGLFVPSHAETPRPQSDTIPPHITEWLQTPSILVFSKTLGWRHNEGIAGADLFFVQLARKAGYGVFTTANAAVFNANDLARFDIVVFNNATGDGLSVAQQGAFQSWLERGGGWLGLHSAGDGSQRAWSWYQDALIGPLFIGHPADPQLQRARLHVLDTAHPILDGVPHTWWHVDEWYSFDTPADAHGARALVGLDETSYRPRNDVYGDVADLRMGPTAADHPIIWVRCIGRGRAVYSAIGHNDVSYTEPHYARLLTNAFDWVASKTDPDGDGCSQHLEARE